MATQASLKVIKSFSWRSAPRLYSNRYYFAGGNPADSTHWTTLSDAVVTAEKAIHITGVSIVQTIGYVAGSDVPVFTKTYATAGTHAPGIATGLQEGQVAALVRYATAARSSKNHPIYLYNYYHRVFCDDVTLPDYLRIATKTAMGTYAAAWIAGFSDGTNVYPRTGPQGHNATGYVVEPFLTHRDFPRA